MKEEGHPSAKGNDSKSKRLKNFKNFVQIIPRTPKGWVLFKGEI
jgi:hypothetical protein